jgi:molybdenum cofactor biosynthesis enzyme
MVDITHKTTSLRTATAQAIVTVGSLRPCVPFWIRKCPKGDVLEVARTAGLFAVKILRSHSRLSSNPGGVYRDCV